MGSMGMGSMGMLIAMTVTHGLGLLYVSLVQLSQSYFYMYIVLSLHAFLFLCAGSSDTVATADIPDGAALSTPSNTDSEAAEMSPTIDDSLVRPPGGTPARGLPHIDDTLQSPVSHCKVGDGKNILLVLFL